MCPSIGGFATFCGYISLYLIEKPENTFKYTLNLKWEAFGLRQKGKYNSSYYSDSANTIEIAGPYVGDIRLTHTWKDWLVYLETTNFLDKHYEKYRGRHGAERVFRLGLQRAASSLLSLLSSLHPPVIDLNLRSWVNNKKS